MENCSNCNHWIKDEKYNIGICVKARIWTLSSYIRFLDDATTSNVENNLDMIIQLDNKQITHTTVNHFCSLHEKKF